ncbi:hypothetical protein GCM10010435_01460 [Winogradskya consettensis]|uniref:Uncharacterized protein n=1 Tax=Winogradskya consettensis TaxID=113560 RepID=A0A919VK98_9ACTN|nr:hypothetical protein Aco04nite_01490 [Actinoplanes consettensis]
MPGSQHRENLPVLTHMMPGHRGAEGKAEHRELIVGHHPVAQIRKHFTQAEMHFHKLIPVREKARVLP